MTLHSCQENKNIDSQQARLHDQQSLFTKLPSSSTQVIFQNNIPESGTMNSMIYEYYYNGGGVAIGDIDNDGWEDIYLVSNLGDNKLYANKGGFNFEDITQKAGVAGSFGWSTGVCMTDVNADGWLDIYVCKSGKGKAQDRKNELFINKQNGTFKEAAAEYGLDFAGYSTQAAFFDYDVDEDLDMFLLNHNTSPINTNTPEQYKNQHAPLVGDKLFQNDGGRFKDVSQEAGLINNPMGFGLGVSIGDLDLDGWPDIYIGNDYIEQDYLYMNNGDGTFTEKLKSSIKHTSNFSMGTDISDFNNDGWPDIISLDMVAEDNYSIKTSMSGMNPKAFYHAVDNGFHYQYMFNALQLNNGQNSFSEIAQLAGVSSTDWSWAPLFADFDNDGWKDLFITNGLKRDFRNNDFRKKKLERLKKTQETKEDLKAVMEDLVLETPQRKTQNYFFQNNHNLTFSKKSTEWGITSSSLSNGAAYADLDNDGDLDLVVNNIDEEAGIFRNNSKQNFLQIKFKGPKLNPFAIGVKIIAKYDTINQMLENFPTRGYQSSVSQKLNFGLGQSDKIEELEVFWPDGKYQKLEEISSNQLITLKYSEAMNVSSSSANKHKKVFFKEITKVAAIDHQHIENQYDDFQKESLLPHKMSQFGPALAVADVNGDDLEDFYIGGAKGYPGELYFQQEDGTFIASKFPLWEKEKAYEDVDAIFFDADNDGDQDLYVVSGGNEVEEGNPLLQDRLYLNDGKKQFLKNNKLLPLLPVSGSCVRPCDFDNDGDLDLFIGGRQTPGKYPHPTNSYLLQNDGGLFENISEEAAPDLKKAGMVTDAIWTDFNQDKQMDLLVVGEWMEITFFKNERGKLLKFSPEIDNQLSPLNGWWSSLASLDFDQDGDEDYIIGNLGLNYKYKASKDQPFEVYCNDFDENGSLDIVLGYYNQNELFPLRGRECSSNQMPFIKEKFPTYHAFGSANLAEVYGKEKLANSLHLSSNIFATILLENLGNDQFKTQKLPNQAQFSSVNAIQIIDVNFDGFLDVIIAGNCYQSEVETSRNDASVGLLLLNKGDGSFSPVEPFNSSLYLNKDVKKLKLIKLGVGEASRSALLVGNNNDYLQLVQIRGRTALQ